MIFLPLSQFDRGILHNPLKNMKKPFTSPVITGMIMIMNNITSCDWGFYHENDEDNLYDGSRV